MTLTPEQVKFYREKYNLNKNTIKIPSKEERRVDLSQNPISALGNKVMGAYESGINQAGEGLSSIFEGSKQQETGAGMQQMGRGALRMGAGLINTAFSPVSGILEETGASKAFQKTGEFIDEGLGISDNPSLQNFVTKNPNSPEVASDLLTVGTSFLGGEKAPSIKGALSPLETTASNLKTGVTNSLKSLPSASTSIVDSLKGFADSTAKSGIQKEIQGVLNSTKGIGNKVKLAEMKGVDLQQNLSDPQIFKGLKVENGKINPDTSIDVLDTRINSLLEIKRQMLPKIDTIVPDIKRSALRQKAIEDIRGKYPPADETSLIAAIDKQIGALPEEIKISDLDALRAKFRAAGRNAKGLQLSSNEYAALENASRDLVFDATDNLPVSGAMEYKSMNDYIKNMITTKEFLDQTLRGQVVKGGRLGNYAMRFVGAIAGSSGGVLGTLAGSEVGGLIADIITNNQLGNSVKVHLIKNLTNDPAILAKAQELLTQIKDLNAPMLPAPKDDFVTKTYNYDPIKLPSELQSAVDAREMSNPAIRDPNQPLDLMMSRKNTANNMTTMNANIDIDTKTSTPKTRSQVPKGQGAIPLTKGYQETGNLTTKILKGLQGKTTVSRQYIMDATNRAELKQAERDITRSVLNSMKGDTINVAEFADKVKSELLPLKVTKNADLYTANNYGGKYENVTLPDELRGNVKNYKENVYESPIKTSAGGVHFSEQGKEGYFGHTRIEDMADNTTRRVIEVQSDLYQKGNLANESAQAKEILDQQAGYEKIGRGDINQNDTAKFIKSEAEARLKDTAKLQQYNDPTAHFRMIREEIKKAAQDGKTKLQFPTGETAMKIEGLGGFDGARTSWAEIVDNGRGGFEEKLLTPEKLKIGKEVLFDNTDEWIITDVLGDGKFKAMPKEHFDSFMESKGVNLSGDDMISYAEQHGTKNFWGSKETFDISGKVDTNNPIYKFYEKDIQQYLKKYGGRKIKDAQGVEWIEIPIKKSMGTDPVEAFSKIKSPYA